MTQEERKRKTYEQAPALIEAIGDLLKLIRREPNDSRYAPQSPRGLIVGGFVRDLLLGLHPKDADIEIFGVEPKRVEEIVNHLFPGCVNFVGESFGILKIHLDFGVEFDVAIPRTESKIGNGHKGFSVNSDPGLSFKEAARRRDFTINAMSIDPLTGELIDPFDGPEDMTKKILRVVDEKTFQEDPLRIYRAIQFAGRLQFEIEPKSLNLMKKMVRRGDLSELSKERVTEEIKKLLQKAERPSIGFQYMRDLGIIERDYPELKALIDTPQEPEWHPEGDVWAHTLLAIDQAARIMNPPSPLLKGGKEGGSLTEQERLQVMIGTLCHDLGKPATTKKMNMKGTARIRSLGHQEAGDEPTCSLMDRWTFGAEIIHAARMITLNHLRPGELWNKFQKNELSPEGYVNAIRRLLKRIYPLSWKVLILSAEADFRGRKFDDADTIPFEYGKLFEKTILAHGLDQAPIEPLVHGKDLIEQFDLKPGPYLGELIRAAENARDEGTVKTKEEALAFIKNLIEVHHEEKR